MECAGLFGNKSDKCDFCLVVEGRELWAPKHVLAWMSPLFEKACFNESFKEAREGKMVLEEHKYDEILTLLKVAIPHPLYDPVSDTNVEVLLRLGHFFMMEAVVHSCVVFIESRMPGPEVCEDSFRHLKMVCKYAPSSDPLIHKLVLRAANLGFEMVAASDEGLPSDVQAKLYKVMLYRYFPVGGGPHVVEQKKRPGTRASCAKCRSRVESYDCDKCGLDVCGRCLLPTDTYTYGAKEFKKCKGNPSHCGRCKERYCLCSY